MSQTVTPTKPFVVISDGSMVAHILVVEPGVPVEFADRFMSTEHADVATTVKHIEDGGLSVASECLNRSSVLSMTDEDGAMADEAVELSTGLHQGIPNGEIEPDMRWRINRDDPDGSLLATLTPLYENAGLTEKMEEIGTTIYLEIGPRRARRLQRRFRNWAVKKMPELSDLKLIKVDVNAEQEI